MAAKPKQATNKMTQLLEKLLNLRQRRAEGCGAINRQYKTFLGEIKKHSQQSFTEFKHTEGGRDTFLLSYLGNIPRYQEIWGFFKLLLTLSNGQAQVERGFSTNKDILSTNMAEELVVAYRKVYDGIRSLGVPMEQCIPSEMLNPFTHIMCEDIQTLKLHRRLRTSTAINLNYDHVHVTFFSKFL